MTPSIVKGVHTCGEGEEDELTHSSKRTTPAVPSMLPSYAWPNVRVRLCKFGLCGRCARLVDTCFVSNFCVLASPLEMSRVRFRTQQPQLPTQAGPHHLEISPRAGPDCPELNSTLRHCGVVSSSSNYYCLPHGSPWHLVHVNVPCGLCKHQPASARCR